MVPPAIFGRRVHRPSPAKLGFAVGGVLMLGILWHREHVHHHVRKAHRSFTTGYTRYARRQEGDIPLEDGDGVPFLLPEGDAHASSMIRDKSLMLGRNGKVIPQEVIPEPEEVNSTAWIVSRDATITRSGEGKDDGGKKKGKKKKKGNPSPAKVWVNVDKIVAEVMAGAAPGGAALQSALEKAEQKRPPILNPPRAGCGGWTGCGEHGNCNRELDRCECEPQWGGVRCEEDLSPACKPRSDYAIPCRVVSMNPYATCECVRQCRDLAAGAGLLHFAASCYKVPDDNATAPLHAPGETGQRMWLSANPTPAGEDVVFELLEEARANMRPGFNDEEPMPLATCLDFCSFQGWCRARRTTDFHGEGPVCECHPGRSGKSCEKSKPAFCPGGCNGGTCEKGFCRCKPGSWGIDCSLTLNPETGKAALWHPEGAGEPSAPRIYVYDLGWVTAGATRYSFQDYQASSGGSSILEPMLRDRVLSSAHRTADPAAADLFFVPLPVGAQLHHVIKHLEAHWVEPGVWRPGGARHVIVSSQERGTAELMMVLHDHMQFRAHGGRGAVPGMLRDASFLTTHARAVGHDVGDRLYNRGHFRARQDVALPPLLSREVDVEVLRKWSPYMGANAAAGGGEGDAGAGGGGRDVLLFYAGDLLADFGEGSELARHLAEWSQHGRAAVEAGGDARRGVAGTRKMQYLQAGKEDYIDGDLEYILERFTRAKFCLGPPETEVPRGVGVGAYRPPQPMMLAVLMGCIPVFSDAGVHPPLDELLDWSKFSVDVEAVPGKALGRHLAAVPPEVLASMQRELECAYPRLLFSSLEGGILEESGWGGAFESAMQLLARRVAGQGNDHLDTCEEGAGAHGQHVCRWPCGASVEQQRMPWWYPGGAACEGTVDRPC